MFLFILTSLLQTFCYGAEGIPEEKTPRAVIEPDAQRPLYRIITEDGVCPFFYHYCQEFHETFQGKEGATPPPPRDDIKGLLTWTEQYFIQNQLRVSSEMCDAFVDHELMEALETKSLTNMSDREKRVFVVPGDFLHSMSFMIRKCAPSNFVFLTTDHRELCPEDFPPSEDVSFLDFDPIKPLLLAIQQHCLSTKMTELMSVKELCQWPPSGLKKTLVLHFKHEPSEIKYLDYFTQNMRLLKSSLSAITETFGHEPDGILSMYPFALSKQKIAECILEEHVNVYDIYPDPQVPVNVYDIDPEPQVLTCFLPFEVRFDSCLLLKGLASAFHAEFIVNLLSERGSREILLKRASEVKISVIEPFKYFEDYKAISS